MMPWRYWKKYSICQPPTLLRCGMDGGLMVIHIVLYAEKTNLEDLMPMYGQIGSQTTAQTTRADGFGEVNYGSR